MSDYTEAPDDNEPDDNTDAILDAAKKAYDKDKDHWETLVYGKAREDLRFLSDDDGAQWNSAEYERRQSTGRIALQIDYLKQYVNQTINGIRKQERVADVVPVGSAGSKETTNVLKGLLKKIQYDSNAEEVFATAVGFAVKCSIGFIKVTHGYQDDSDSDNDKQVIQLERVVNPFNIYLDSESIALNGSDAKHCFEIERMSQKEFKERWPDAEVAPFEERGNQEYNLKKDDDVSVAYYEVKETSSEDILGKDGKKKRSVNKTKIMCYVLSGKEILEQSESPFKFISTIPVYGEEAWEDGKRKLHSLIRKSKQSQAQYNLLQSIKTEILLNYTRANVIAPGGSVEAYAEDWTHPDKSMVLRYDHIDENGNPLPPPTQIMPPQVSSGMVEATQASVNDIRSTIGLYQENQGQESNAESGIAINARKIQGDNQVYHFCDNAVHAIEQTCRVILSGIGKIYDTGRIEQIINEEEEPELVYLNFQVPADPQQAAMMAQQLQQQGIKTIANVVQGKYDVRVTVGASFSTQRQEAEAFLRETIAGNPQLMMMYGDLLFKYADFAGSDQMSERAKKMLPPQLQDQANGQDPQVAAMAAQLQQAMQVIQQLQAELKSKQADQQIKMAGIQATAQSKQQDNQFDLIKHAADVALETRSLNLKQQQQAQTGLENATRLHMDNLAQQVNHYERLTLRPAQQGGHNPAANSGTGL
ncbi:MAG: hypothetical protein KGH74_05450 [Candidatus Micrarchaeota archaeon]|nr:hypothetical protein [Candidatus Micrarchaeota archaeon]